MTIPIHSRLVLWNLSIIFIIAFVLGFFLTGSVRNYFQTDIENELRQQTELVATILQTEPDTPMDDLASKVNARVSVISVDGELLDDSDRNDAALRESGRTRPEVQQAIDTGTGSAVRSGIVYAARRLDSSIVILAKPLGETDDVVRDIQIQLAYAMVIAAGLSLLFGYIVRGLISSPLLQLSTASKKLADGDLDQRLPITGDEAIATLGASLNTMASNLSSKIRELSDGKQRLELILGAMREGMLVLDGRGQISLANQSIREIVGSQNDLSGMTLLEVFRRPELENTVRRVLAGGPSEVVEIVTSNNRVLQANIAPVVKVSGVVDSVVVVFHDLTDIRRIERIRRDFVANVSHEFKTPLTSIRGYAETLLGGARDDPKVEADFLRTIERNARYLELLVSELLTLARLESEPPASTEPVNVRHLIDEQVSARWALLNEYQIRVEVDCPLVEILADRSRTSAALSNLLDNAIHYNRQGGEIKMTGTTDNGAFKLTIADTGHGIPAEELHRIFERFYRVDKARSRESGGTGLGLAIVKHAIESQGGTIRVESRVGAGSKFTIYLPRATAKG